MKAEPEPVLRHVVAGRLVRGVNAMGGTLVLTPRRLVFLPLVSRSGLQLSDRAATLSKQLHDWSLHPQKLLNAAVKPLTTAIEIPLARIESVEATRRCAVRVVWNAGTGPRRNEFGISAGRFSPIWSPDNVAARDGPLAAISAARTGGSPGLT